MYEDGPEAADSRGLHTYGNMKALGETVPEQIEYRPSGPTVITVRGPWEHVPFEDKVQTYTAPLDGERVDNPKRPQLDVREEEYEEDLFGDDDSEEEDEVGCVAGTYPLWSRRVQCFLND